MTSLSLRERRLIAILLLLAMIAIVWLGLVSPILSGFKDRAEKHQLLQQEFARNERQIGTISSLRRSVENQRLADSDFRTSGDTIAAATETLKERLGTVITGQGGELRAVQDVSERPGWARIWAEAKMTLPQLVATLGKLQNQKPLLVVNGVTISADRAQQSGKLDIMDVRIEISSPIAPTKSR